MELTCGDAGARIELTTLRQPNLREADDEAAKEAQGKGRFGIANPTSIFSQSDVQSMMEAAFDGPIASFEFE